MVWLYLDSAFLGLSIVAPVTTLTGYKILGIDFSVFAWPVAYFLGGALLSKTKISGPTAAIWGAMFVVSGIGTAVGTWLYSTIFFGKPNEALYNFYYPFVAVGAGSGFLSLKWLGERLFQRFRRIVPTSRRIRLLCT